MLNNQKTFFIVPGFQMQANHKMFSWLIKYLESRKHKVIKVPVKWDYSTLTKNAKEFEKFYNLNKGKNNSVLGFSYGAVITLLTASHLKPNQIYLCSLSADFKEDSVHMSKRSRIYIGKRRYEDTKNRSGIKLAKELSVPSVIFYGEVEGNKYPTLRKRCEETSKLAKNSKLLKVKDAPHDISHPEYQKAIKSIIN